MPDAVEVPVLPVSSQRSAHDREAGMTFVLLGVGAFIGVVGFVGVAGYIAVKAWRRGYNGYPPS